MPNPISRPLRRGPLVGRSPDDTAYEGASERSVCRRTEARRPADVGAESVGEDAVMLTYSELTRAVHDEGALRVYA